MSRSSRSPGATSMRSPPDRSKLSLIRTVAAGGSGRGAPSASSSLSRSTTAAEFVPSPSIVTVQFDRPRLAPAQTPNAAHRPSAVHPTGAGRCRSLRVRAQPDRRSSQTDGAVGSLGSAGVGRKRIRGRVRPGSARMVQRPSPAELGARKLPIGVRRHEQDLAARGGRPRASRNSSAVRKGGGRRPVASGLTGFEPGGFDRRFGVVSARASGGRLGLGGSVRPAGWSADRRGEGSTSIGGKVGHLRGTVERRGCRELRLRGWASASASAWASPDSRGSCRPAIVGASRGRALGLAARGFRDDRPPRRAARRALDGPPRAGPAGTRRAGAPGRDSVARGRGPARVGFLPAGAWVVVGAGLADARGILDPEVRVTDRRAAGILAGRLEEDPDPRVQVPPASPIEPVGVVGRHQGALSVARRGDGRIFHPDAGAVPSNRKTGPSPARMLTWWSHRSATTGRALAVSNQNEGPAGASVQSRSRTSTGPSARTPTCPPSKWQASATRSARRPSPEAGCAVDRTCIAARRPRRTEGRGGGRGIGESSAGCLRCGSRRRPRPPTRRRIRGPPGSGGPHGRRAGPAPETPSRRSIGRPGGRGGPRRRP